MGLDALGGKTEICEKETFLKHQIACAPEGLLIYLDKSYCTQGSRKKTIFSGPATKRGVGWVKAGSIKNI